MMCSYAIRRQPQWIGYELEDKENVCFRCIKYLLQNPLEAGLKNPQSIVNGSQNVNHYLTDDETKGQPGDIRVYFHDLYGPNQDEDCYHAQRSPVFKTIEEAKMYFFSMVQGWHARILVADNKVVMQFGVSNFIRRCIKLAA